jgi:hypothetical protein
MRARLANRLAFRWRINQLHRKPLAYYTERLKAIPRVDCPDRVVVTFTTIPERIGQIAVMLKSLLDQSVLPDSICLCVPKTSRLPPFTYSIPSWFSQIPILNIVECEHDLGPVTKFIPTWQQQRHMPDTRLIIVDDDGVYSHRLIEQLVRWSQHMPDAALGCSGVAVPVGMKPSSVIFSRDPWLQDLRYTSFSSDALSRVDYLFGYAGVLVKPRFFDDAVTDYSAAPKQAFFDDDVWLGGHMARRGIDRWVIPALGDRLMPGASRRTLDTRALCLTDNQDGFNSDQTFDYLFGPASRPGSS